MDPRLTALEADLFWLPEAYARVLTAVVTPQPRPFESSRFSLADLACEKTLLLRPDESQHLLLQAQYRFLQLLCIGDSLLSRTCGMGLLANEVPAVERKLRLMRRFAEIVRSGGVPMCPVSWTPQSLSLRNALIALDGRLRGASHREIAEVIFGRDRVAREWQGGQGWMKSRIARAAARGWRLAEGGYRALLM